MATQVRSRDEMRAKVRLSDHQVAGVQVIPDDMFGLLDETLLDTSTLKKVMPPEPEEKPARGWRWKPPADMWLNDPEWDGFGLWPLQGYRGEAEGPRFDVDTENHLVTAVYPTEGDTTAS